MDRPRLRSRQTARLIGADVDAVRPSAAANTGVIAAAAWLAARELTPGTARWSVEVALDAVSWGGPDHSRVGGRFTIEIYSEEWGFAFRHRERMS